MSTTPSIPCSTRPHGVRRYRVWSREGRIDAIAAPLRVGRWRRLGRVCRCGLGVAAACGLCASRAGPALAVYIAGAVCLLLAGALARSHWIRSRPCRLRRRGARPGPWVWAIDAESAICTARIRANGLRSGAAHAFDPHPVAFLLAAQRIEPG